MVGVPGGANWGLLDVKNKRRKTYFMFRGLNQFGIILAAGEGVPEVREGGTGKRSRAYKREKAGLLANSRTDRV